MPIASTTKRAAAAASSGPIRTANAANASDSSGRTNWSSVVLPIASTTKRAAAAASSGPIRAADATNAFDSLTRATRSFVLLKAAATCREAARVNSGLQSSESEPISPQSVWTSKSQAGSCSRAISTCSAFRRLAGSRPSAAWTAMSARFRSCSAVLGFANACSTNKIRTRSCAGDKAASCQTASISEGCGV